MTQSLKSILSEICLHRLAILTALALISRIDASDSGTTNAGHHTVRSTGTTQALHSYVLQVPSIEGQNGNLTLTTIVENGSHVAAGEVVAQFDDTDQLKLAREAKAKFDDLSHQVEQKRAELRNNAEKRNSDLMQAEADLQKAEIETRKAPILSEIEQQKNTVKLEDAHEHVASLKRSNHHHDVAEGADLRILELQRDRQKIAVDRQLGNAGKLVLKTPIPGMVALQNIWRNESMGHAREGDQLWPGQGMVRVFDPASMIVEVAVAEPDGAVLVPGVKAVVHLDAFPNLSLAAHLDSASPVATSGVGGTVKTFSARFILDTIDSHVLPDLSAAVDIEAAQ
jgi:multidrug resistance efflux pump